VVQECADRGCVEVGEAELGGLPAGALGDEAEQELEGVAVGGHRVGAGLALVDELVGEEPLQQGREVGQDVGGWDLGGRVQHLEVAGEAAHHHQPTAPVDLVGAAWRCGRPGQRRVGGDDAGAALLEVADEAEQPGAKRGQLEPQRAAHRQVGLGVLAD
jgi:hypothetical protein